ncbi:MAG: hypothetical protein EA426_04025 [Spirochaetaceae bacterium]|nr:MAG: hypothetical protein EA426_04025 [Spirochaetaceae bacterium]
MNGNDAGHQGSVDERTMILKMLKEDKITIEEAEALLKVLDTSDDDEAGFTVRDAAAEPAAKSTQDEAPRGGPETDETDENTETDDSESRRSSGPHGRPGSGTGEETRHHGFSFDFGFGDLGREISRSVKQVLDEVNTTVKSHLSEESFDLHSTLASAFGKKKAEADRSFTVPADGITNVILKNTWGDVAISGDDRSEITIDARIVAWGADDEQARSRADEATVRHVVDGAELTLDLDGADENKRIRTDYTIHVPRRLGILVRVKSGEVAVDDVSGEVAVATMSGDVKINGCPGDLNVRTKSGDITIAGAEGSAEVMSTTGDLELEFRRCAGCTVGARTTTGDVELVLPPDAAVRIEAQTTSGEIECTLDLNERAHSKNSLSGTFNAPTGSVAIKTVTGDVTIKT